MKLVTPGTGTTFIDVSGDEVSPLEGLLQRDLVEYVGNAYSFSNRPIIVPNTPVTNYAVLTFQMGKLIQSEQTLAIQQISMFSDGDAITASTTEISDIVADDLLRRMDADLKYRYSEKPRARLYYSAIIVDFDTSLEERISAFKKIEHIMGAAVRRKEPFKIKTLQFGQGDPVPSQLTSVAAAKTTDFSLQRRIGSPHSLNRYVSVAPLKTADHIKVLGDIEAALS